MGQEGMSSYSEGSATDNGEAEQLVLAKLFEEFGTSHDMKKNAFIFRGEEESQEIYFVRDGLVKISQFAQEGQSITLFLRHKGEMFGAAEVLTGQKRQRYARCITDSRILSIPASQFTGLLKRHPDTLYALTVVNARRLLQTQRYVETLISRPVAWRLAQLLMQLGVRVGKETVVTLPLSHEEISYVIGCSRQTVTETLGRWRDEGSILYEKKMVVILDTDEFQQHL
ncbi:cAMP-activated global transcriptional regulator CRP [Paenibacillus albidus]|uniref:cAMP-activated global transcriptional regulator CRP n=1 Tax=Paenibacillus albidus TaxID=2041023 RepID=A0A917CJC3_9BACL|nr:Crp/Fnr family transcriptional regulator [Paenibacillus albidus]GGF90592.1 cAMP-activated global transcriptional regulator CRP [Paenibacillus albidus]